MLKIIKLLWFACSCFLIIFSFIATSSTFTLNTYQEKIIICGVCKNIEAAIPNMKFKIETLGSCFKDYRVIIYENNSTDHTLEQLKAWARTNQKIILIHENLSKEQLSARTKFHALKDKGPCRMELIAYGRNQVLQRAMKSDFNDFNYLLMTDLDFKVGWRVQDILACFSLKQPWDCIAANSITFGLNGLRYYDRYAYRDAQFPFGPELLGEEFWKIIKQQPIKIKTDSSLIQVYSAFGGVALYRKNALKECHYSGYVTDDLRILTSNIINSLPISHPQYQLYKTLNNLKTKDSTLIFRQNSGYDGPVVCEHSTLHATMALHGHDKIYVNPNLLCRY